VIHQPHSAGPSSNPSDDSAHPLSDEQAMAQVVEPAKLLVAAANLDGIDAGFSFESCNDQGDPPYRGRVALIFLIHGDSDAYLEKVQNAMVTNGWNAGGLPGQVSHATLLNKDGVTANMSLLPSDRNYGQILLQGQCRNTTDHRNDGKTNGTNITDQLQPR
jgi:hypothetical protein